MVGLVLFILVGAAFAALGMAAARWGVDSRDWSFRIW
jgi:hypothetical protein